MRIATVVHHQTFRCPLRTATALLLMAAALLVAGCGAEKREAAKFCKVLQAQSDVLQAVNAQEDQFVAQIGQWSGSIAFAGIGMNPNQGNVQLFQQQCNALISRFDSIRNAIEIDAVSAAYLQTQKSAIDDKLKARRNYLVGFLGSLNIANQAWNSTGGLNVPPGIPQVSTQAQTHVQPDNPIATAVTAIRTKYEITDADLR